LLEVVAGQPAPQDQHAVELRPGLDWLSLHRPPPSRPASLLHLDWHPLNLIRGEGGGLTVLDWTEADVGDPHADLGTALMMIERRRVETLQGLLDAAQVKGQLRRAGTSRRVPLVAGRPAARKNGEPPRRGRGGSPFFAGPPQRTHSAGFTSQAPHRQACSPPAPPLP
jgi:hypothetical protein